MTNDTIRASDSDREKVVAILRDAYAAGRLTLAEFDERTSAAFAGRTWGDLRKLASDLPGDLRFGPELPAAQAPAPGTRAAPAAPAGQPGGSRWPGRPMGARLIPALPIAFVWLAISLSARSALAFVPIVVLLLIGLRVAGGQRPDQGPHHDPRRPPGPDRPGRPF
jgi:hypothetical protein